MLISPANWFSAFRLWHQKRSLNRSTQHILLQFSAQFYSDYSHGTNIIYNEASCTIESFSSYINSLIVYLTPNIVSLYSIVLWIVSSQLSIDSSNIMPPFILLATIRQLYIEFIFIKKLYLWLHFVQSYRSRICELTEAFFHVQGWP